MADSGVFAPPEGMTVHAALYSIFTHYCKNLKAASKPTGVMNTELSMDGKSFCKLCLEAPDLGNYIGRTDVDLIFTKSKPLGVRRLEYDHFLDALLQLALRIYPDEEPTKALTYVLANFVFGVFEQERGAKDADAVIEQIYSELNL
jgi:hypothetical protein